MVLKGSVNFGPRGSTALGFGGHAHRAFPSDFGSSLIFRKKCLGERQGSVRAVSRPLQLLLFLGGFGNSCRIVFGQFYSFSGSFRAVFRRKMTDWTIQSVIVNR